jgi:hypothetical protein
VLSPASYSWINSCFTAGKRIWVCTIDYRCHDEKKESEVETTSWYHCVAEDFRIPKMPVINPLQALVHPQTHITILRGLSIPNLYFSEFGFLVNRSADKELWISIFQAIDEFVSSKNPNLLF